MGINCAEMDHARPRCSPTCIDISLRSDPGLRTGEAAKRVYPAGRRALTLWIDCYDGASSPDSHTSNCGTNGYAYCATKCC
jgi:hypothetical protein